MHMYDLATHLTEIAARAYPGKDAIFVEDEIADQFTAALKSRELSIAVS